MGKWWGCGFNGGRSPKEHRLASTEKQKSPELGFMESFGHNEKASRGCGFGWRHRGVVLATFLHLLLLSVTKACKLVQVRNKRKDQGPKQWMVSEGRRWFKRGYCLVFRMTLRTWVGLLPDSRLPHSIREKGWLVYTSTLLFWKHTGLFSTLYLCAPIVMSMT